MNRSKIDRKLSKEEGKVLLSVFHGVCYIFGKTGHRAKQCNNKENKNTGKPNLHCNHCGKLGHIASNCWFKEENRDKRLQGFKKGEKAKIVEDLNESNEFLLGMTDGNTIKDDIWIADSAATVQMTSDATGLLTKQFHLKHSLLYLEKVMKMRL